MHIQFLYNMTVYPIAFQGEPHAYSDQAITEFGKVHDIEFESHGRPGFDGLIEGAQELGLGMMPISNSTAGLVHTAMDELIAGDMLIIGEHYLAVNHNLLGWQPEGDLSLEGKVVHSHWQALGQCREFIRDNGMLAKEAGDTAGAARYVSELEGDERYQNFAIAGDLAAEAYNLKIIVPRIQDKNGNTTRFLVIRPSDRPSPVEESIQASEGQYKMGFLIDVLPKEVAKVIAMIAEQGFNPYGFQTRPSPWDTRSDRVYGRVMYGNMTVYSRKRDDALALEGILNRPKNEGGFGDRSFINLGLHPSGKLPIYTESK